MSLVRTLSKVASTAIIAGAALVAIPAAAVAAPAANSAESCIPEGGGIGNGNPNAVDGQANVYVGGNFTLTSGAELEGLLVVEGNATFGGAGLYNAGVVGVGSLLTPPPMSDMILVGGDMAVTQGRQLDVGHAIGGGVRVGGKLTAAPNAIETNGAELVSNVGKAAALGDRTALGGVIAQQSKAYAAMKTTGTATAEYGTLTLKGDGSENRQVFSLTATEVAAASSLKYENINPEAIVVVNVVGDVAKFNLTAMLNAKGMTMDPMNLDKSAFGALTQRLLWNFPTAKDVVIGGTAQFPGSVLVANPASTTAVKVPGTNGRMWVAGNLVHDLGTGSEIHAFPFLDGDVFGCDPTPPPSVELAQPKVTQAVCLADGKVSAPKVELPTSSTLNYALSGKVAAGETVTVTATSLNGNKIAALVGWTLASDALSATIKITLDDVACDQPVAPVAPTVTQAVCTEDGSATAPKVTVAETAGVTYEVAGDVKAGSTVTITATADKGSFLKPAKGWTVADDKMTATFTVELADTACDQPGTPVMPRISEAECTVSGAPTLPAVTPVVSAGISYTIEGEPVAGGTVTVTATAVEGFFLKVVEGWKYAADNRSATLTVSFADLACDQPVAPVAPIVDQAVCTEEGSATAPTVTVAETVGITYEVAGEVKAGSTVTVTATANAGNFLEEVEGWVLSDDKKSATFTVDLADIACDQPVAPVAPTVTQAVCTEDGSATLPTITFAETVGANYEVIGEVLPGKSVKVVAKPTAGFFFTAADGWVATDAGAEFTVQLDEVDCITIPVKPEPEPTPVPEEKSVPPTDLAVSGAGSLPAVGIGAAALLILGVSALLVTRARRSRSIAE